VSALGAAARRTNALLDDVPALASEGGSTLREAVAAERQALLKGVNGQRVETLAYLTAERLAVAAALREERIATVAALRQERIESLKEIDAIKSRAVDSAVAGLRGIVDFALWRFAILLLLLLAAAAVLATLTYHLTIGRRPPAAP
jgi:hypothetical protein